jgi:tRNA nucleotidyltransferase (CCA-adding enzyme)
MSITRENIKETIRQIMSEESDYQTFFKKALEKAGKSIPSMSDEEKKEFFNKIDAAWNAKGEKNEELTGNQHKLDVDGDGEIEASDLAALRAGKKKEESIEESAGCNCGCGGCSESVNEAATDRDFEKVYSIFDKKDYFGLKGSIKTMLGNWQRALDKGDKGAQKYSKEDVINSVTAQTKARAKHTYDELVKAIKNKDINALKSKLRHDQPFSIAIFTQVTGKKLPKSTRDIHSFLDNEFTNESVNEGRAFINAARKAKEEGKTEFEFNGKTYPVTLKEETINERRLGKVSLLKSVEDGETSRVEGVKISPDLAFELRMFLQRPMLARTRTGIAIDNAQMKDAIVMLAKVGIHKRLSSGVKKEFADLLKKYK